MIPNNLEKINLAANGQWQQKEDEKIGHGRKLKSGNPRMWKQNLKGTENNPSKDVEAREWELKSEGCGFDL